jgi:hypothetical protein
MVERVDVERVVGVFDGVPYGGDGVGGGEEEEGDGQGDIQGKKGEEKERNGSGKGERRFSCRVRYPLHIFHLPESGLKVLLLTYTLGLRLGSRMLCKPCTMLASLIYLSTLRRS